MNGNEINRAALEALLGEQSRLLRFYPKTDSTNARAKALAPDEEGLLVVAAEQTQGRGRLDRSWQSGAGLNVCMSVALKRALPPDKLALVTLAAGLAVAEHIRSLGLDGRIKWPNDVLIGGKKVCGILCQSALCGDKAAVVAGIGINVNQGAFEGELEAKATSLCLALGKPLDPNAVAVGVYRRFIACMDRWGKEGFEPILEDYRALSHTIGRVVTVNSLAFSLTGLAEDVDELGRLVLRDREGGVRHMNFGDVSVR